MKRKIFLLLTLISVIFVKAQIHEIGVFAGGSNYVGDIGSTSYLIPNEYAFGVLYKWNKSPRHSWRVSYLQSKITGNDQNSDLQNRQQRNYNFENSIKELSLGLEFNFFNFNLHNFEPQITPYVYSGVSYIQHEGLYFVNGKPLSEGIQRNFAVPMVVGIKTNIAPQLILALEAGARYTFTDNLDGNNPKSSNLSQYKFGNTNSNDWIMFSGFTLTYTFGKKPCYCRD
jgi:hypothetical protein